MAHEYGVGYIEADELPESFEWAFVKTDADDLLLFIKRDSVCPRVLEEAWTAYRLLAVEGTGLPARVPVSVG